MRTLFGISLFTSFDKLNFHFLTEMLDAQYLEASPCSGAVFGWHETSPGCGPASGRAAYFALLNLGILA
jgi:hypothetical protein